jgi:hypothetical protein
MVRGDLDAMIQRCDFLRPFKSKRDSSTAQTDNFAAARLNGKASVCSARNDRFLVIRVTGYSRNDLKSLDKNLSFNCYYREITKNPA